jgi:hypothetical protein
VRLAVVVALLNLNDGRSATGGPGAAMGCSRNSFACESRADGDAGIDTGRKQAAGDTDREGTVSGRSARRTSAEVGCAGEIVRPRPR